MYYIEKQHPTTVCHCQRVYIDTNMYCPKEGNTILAGRVAPCWSSIWATHPDFLCVKRILILTKKTLGNHGLMGFNGDLMVVHGDVPSGKRLHNELENHHCSWVNQRTQWTFIQ